MGSLLLTFSIVKSHMYKPDLYYVYDTVNKIIIVIDL